MTCTISTNPVRNALMPFSCSSRLMSQSEELNPLFIYSAFFFDRIPEIQLQSTIVGPHMKLQQVDQLIHAQFFPDHVTILEHVLRRKHIAIFIGRQSSRGEIRRRDLRSSIENLTENAVAFKTTPQLSPALFPGPAIGPRRVEEFPVTQSQKYSCMDRLGSTGSNPNNTSR